MKDHIEEYFASQSDVSKELNAGKELFKGESENIDLKTELEAEEIIMVNILHYNNEILEKLGINPPWKPFLEKFMRLKVSLKRQSRAEFVSVNKKFEDSEQTLDKMSNISNILGAKK